MITSFQNEAMERELETDEPFQNDVLPEYLNWAVSANGISSCR